MKSVTGCLRLCGGMSPGTNKTLPSLQRSSAAWATARCPLWIGSKVPPKRPIFMCKKLTTDCADDADFKRIVWHSRPRLCADKTKAVSSPDSRDQALGPGHVILVELAEFFCQHPFFPAQAQSEHQGEGDQGARAGDPVGEQQGFAKTPRKMAAYMGWRMYL